MIKVWDISSKINIGLDKVFFLHHVEKRRWYALRKHKDNELDDVCLPIPELFQYDNRERIPEEGYKILYRTRNIQFYKITLKYVKTIINYGNFDPEEKPIMEIEL